MRALTQVEVARLMKNPRAKIIERPRSIPGPHWAGECGRPQGRPPDSWPRSLVPGLVEDIILHVGERDLEEWLATTPWGSKSHPRVDAALRLLTRKGRIHYRHDLGAWRPGRPESEAP